MKEAFFTAFIAVLIAYVGSKGKRPSFSLLLSFIILTTFLSLGYYWGNDVQTYEDWYQGFVSSGVAWWDFSNYDSFTQHDYGFILLNLLCKPFGFWGMRAILFVFENAIIYNFVKRHVDKKYYWLAVFIYVFNPYFWVLGSSMTRQWLAMCIVLFGTDYLLREKYLYYILFVILASSVHITALICLLFIPLCVLHKNPSTNKVVLFIILIVFYWILSPVFIDYVELYLKTEEMFLSYTDIHGTVGVSSIGRLLIYTLLLFYSVKSKQRDNLFNWIIMLYCLVLPLLYLGELSSRLSLYFTLFTIAIYPLFMNNPKLPRKRKTIIVAIVCSYLVYNFVVFFQSPTYFKYFGVYRTIIGNL